MKLTSNYNLKKPDGADVVNINDFNDNADKIDDELKKVNVKADDMSFTTASNRENIKSGDTRKVVLGKIAKWFGELKALAFKEKVAVGDLDSSVIAHDLITMHEGKVLGADQGGVLLGKIGVLNDNLDEILKEIKPDNICTYNKNFTYSIPYPKEDAVNKYPVDFDGGIVEQRVYGYFRYQLIRSSWGKFGLWMRTINAGLDFENTSNSWIKIFPNEDLDVDLAKYNSLLEFALANPFGIAGYTGTSYQFTDTPVSPNSGSWGTVWVTGVDSGHGITVFFRYNGEQAIYYRGILNSDWVGEWRSNDLAVKEEEVSVNSENIKSHNISAYTYGKTLFVKGFFNVNVQKNPVHVCTVANIDSLIPFDIICSVDFSNNASMSFSGNTLLLNSTNIGTSNVVRFSFTGLIK